MKVLLIHHASALGGGSISLLDVVAMLREEHEVIVCAPASPSWLSSELERRGVEFSPAILPLPIYYHYNGTAGAPICWHLMLRGLLTYLRYRSAWIEVIRDSGAQIVIVNSAALCLFGPIIRAAGAKPICFVRETFPPSSRSVRTRILYRVLGRHFSRSVFLSERDREAAALPPSRAAVLLDCMRQDELREKGRKEARRELSIAENYFWVLFTGGNSRLKGFDTALRAIGRTRLSEIRLLAVGVGGDAMTPNVKLRNWVADPRNAYYRLRVAALLKSRSVQERVVLLGPRNDMSVPYSASDVVIFPSSLAHQARPVYEAGSFGLPIVISDFPSAAEFVFPGSNGLLIPPRDAPKLAAALDMLASQREYCAALGAENRRQHSSRRQFSVMQRLLVELVKDVGEEGP